MAAAIASAMPVLPEVAFELAQDQVAALGVFRGVDALQGNQGGLADGVFDRRIIHASHCAIILGFLPDVPGW